MKWGMVFVGPKTPDHRQPPLGGLLDIHAGFGVATGRSSDLQARPFARTAFLLTRLPDPEENQWFLGIRSCLPLRGSSGFSPDSL
jgi:hypothetical protein